MLTDAQIKGLAEKRVSFKVHAGVFVVMNVFFAILWFVQSRFEGGDSYYWPIWPHLGWGIGLFFHGWSAYGPGPSLVEREEAALRRKMGRAP